VRASNEIEAEILHVLDSLCSAITARDLDATMHLFAPDQDVTLQASEAGTLATGPQALRAFFARLYARPVGFSWEWSHRLVSASGDVAWLFAQGVEVVTEGEHRHRVPYRLSGVLQRRSDRWVWLQVHGSEPARAPEQAPVAPAPAAAVASDSPGLPARQHHAIGAQVRAAYERYLSAFVQADLAAIDEVVAYPLAHIGQTGVRLFDTFPINPADLKAAKGWHATVNARYEVVAVSARKAHVLLYSADRIRKDGSLIETVSAFYAFTRTDTGWKLYALSDVVNPAPQAGGTEPP
jgi:ketosteroid isomerase-like protein